MRTNYQGIIDRANTKSRRFRSGGNRRSGKYKTVFDRDLAAMTIVLRMLKCGTIRAFGEIGRQYY